MPDNLPNQKSSRLDPTLGPISGSKPQLPNHQLLRCIGHGAFGEVWLARNVMGTYRAVKVLYRRNFSDERPYEREFRGLQKFEPISRSHDGFVDILDTGLDAAEGYFYYVMELADDVLLGSKIDPESYQPRTLDRETAKHGCVPVQTCVSLGVSLSAALGHLHRHGLLHRDIKPSNIIFVNGIPKIADIGLVSQVEGTQTFPGGTDGYYPPTGGPGTVQADIYALGKVLYELSTGLDRFEFPDLPTRLDEMQDPDQFRELNQVILKACESDPRKQYRKTEDLHADLLLLMAGKSVRRIRALEKRVAQLIQVGAVAALVLLMGGGVLYTWNRQQLMQRKNEQLRLNLAHGNTLAEEGDFLGALPFYGQALRLERDMSLSEKNHRLRIGVLLELCPRITELLVLNGQHLNAADFSRDGRYVLTAGEDGTASLCDLRQRSKRQPWHKEENHALYAVSFSPKGAYAAIAGGGFAKIWDIATDTLACSVTPPGFVSSVRFTADESQFVVASGDGDHGYVYLYDMKQPGPGTKLTSQQGYGYRCAALSPDGTRLVTACENGIAQVWDFRSRQPMGDPIGHPNWVNYAAFSPDGRRVVTAGADGTVKVCEAETGKLTFTLRHPTGVASAEFSPDGRYIVTAGWDSTARIWDALTGELVQPTLKQSGRSMVYASFCPDGHHVLAVNANGVVCLWDLATPIRRSPGRGYALASEDGHRLFTIQGNHIEVLDPTNRAHASSFVVTDTLQEVALNKDGTRLMTLSEGPRSENPTTLAQLWDTENAKTLSGPFSIGSTSTKAFLNAEGARMVTWEGKQATVWDTLTGFRLYSLDHMDAVADKGCFSPDGAWLATIGEKTNVYIWNGNSTKPWCILPHPDKVEHVAFSPDSRLLVTCVGSPGTFIERDAQIWELTSRKKVGPPLSHDDGVLYAEFSHDGKRLVTASEDATARVWDVPSGRLLLLLQHGSSVSEARFSSDGRWIVTASPEAQAARVWDAQTGEALTPPLKHSWQFVHVQFVADGQEIFTRRSRPHGGQTMLWELPIEKRNMEELDGLAKVLSGRQSNPMGAVLPQTPENLKKTWEARSPKDFTVSTEDVINWYLLEAEASEMATQLNAAVFHWSGLTNAKPNEQTYRDRLKMAQDKMERPNALSPARDVTVP